ncbi:MAG: molybdopterin molybdotransferase MoeA [Janthinobacterium lividum]
MLSVDEARRRILMGLRPLPAEIVSVLDAWGRVAAAPLQARLNNPPNDISAMDGYAVRSADTTPGTLLSLTGEAPAGHPFKGTVGQGECIRLFTGSVMPHGADCVLIQENAERREQVVEVRQAVAPARHIRRQGQDFAIGDVLVPAGRRLGARDIGVAAAGNHAWAAVHRRPRIALLATGDELALPGEPIPPGGVTNSNTPMLAALVRAAGGDPVLLPLVRDDAEAIARATDGLAGIDMLVTIGGASVGDYDLVQTALAARGLEVDFWKIAMRPGKPLMHGHIGAGGARIPVLGLPGNPVSALVCGLLFLIPALQVLSGETDSEPAGGLERERATLAVPLEANDHRADHLRASFTRSANGAFVVTPFPRQDSGMLRRLADCEALILRAPNAPAAAAGTDVEILRLDRLGI